MIAVLAILGCGDGPPRDTVPAEVTAPVHEDGEVTVTPVEGAGGPVVQRDWAGETEQLRKRLAMAEKRLAAAPDAWTAHLGVMAAHLDLGRLVGGMAHHDAAWESWKRASAIDPTNPKVKRAHAGLLQSEHRFRDALAELDGLDGREDRAARASIRFELGEYEPAIAELTALLEEEREPSVASRLANHLAKLGRFDEAEATMAIAQKTYHGRDQWIVGWMHLMLGLMDLDRERYDDAMAHYRDADAAFPGWWLVQEHMAEIHAVQGRPADALPIYEAVVAQTQSPELMGALADTLDALGRTDEGTAMRAKALAGFEAQLQSHPTSAGGHALEFLLEHGDPTRCLELAKANVALRPNGEAKLLLADALERTGDASGAASLRAEVASSGWWVGP